MKTVFVTGASGGIGEAIAKKFAGNGYFVGVGYNTNRGKAENLAKEIAGVAVKADVSDEKSVSAAMNDFLLRAGKLDVLVNSAGIALPIKTLLDTTSKEFDKAFSVNVKGVYNCCKAAIPAMLDGGGSIINISSMWGVTGGSCEAIYSASKAAVIGFTKALAKEYAAAGITINCVAPGYIDTPMNDNLSDENKKLAIADIPVGRVGEGEDVAKAVFYLAENGGFVTGEVLSVNGGEVV
ncbi:short-chain dehydrogenase/reductase SDR [Acidiphilium sp. CAG:727]|nr:short-chain dehydrogenase/reductase SDR [Acidiphilium sp. CAG:727]